MKRLLCSQIVRLHQKLVSATGGNTGLRDKGALESCMQTPFSTFDGAELYPSIEEKASCMAYLLVKNHCFVDGNKRIGVTAMLVFLQMNDVVLIHTQDELVSLGLCLADSQISKTELLQWIITHKK